MIKNFSWSRVKEQIAEVNGCEIPPLTRSLNEALPIGLRSQPARKCSAVAVFSDDQMADKSETPPSTGAPNNFTAASLARQILPEPSTSIAGHPACSKTKTASNFIS